MENALSKKEKTTMGTNSVLIAIDEANLLWAAKGMEKKVDYLRLRDYLASEGEGRQLVEAVVYVGLPPEMPAFSEARQKKLGFVHWLRTNGFMVVTKDGSPTEQGRFKANVDVLMAIDVLDLASEIHPDIVVAVTGDSDFAYLAEKLRRRGIRVEIASLEQALGGPLRAAANDVIDLREVLNECPNLNGKEGNVIGTDGVLDNVYKA